MTTISTSMLQTATIWQERQGVRSLEQPRLPSDFVLTAQAMPLLTPNDGRWIARVFHIPSESEGLLIFEDQYEVVYFTSDEIVTSVAYTIREVPALLATCDVTFSDAHARTVDHLRSVWWKEETRKARAILGIGEPSRQGEEQV